MKSKDYIDKKYDVVIIGSGIVGTCIAYSIATKSSLTVALVDKEETYGLHTSGRNSGVLHAGIYYTPNSLKANLCIEGKNRLERWAMENKCNINQCGKLVIPRKPSDITSFENILSNASKNGVEHHVITTQNAKDMCSLVDCPLDIALFVPSTSVCSPKQILSKLHDELDSLPNFTFYPGEYFSNVDPATATIYLSSNRMQYSYLFNAAGAYASSVASKFLDTSDLQVIPFRGNYLSLSKEISSEININLYPVPLDKQTFLGVHFSPSATPSNGISYIGPTANLALGRENYFGLEKVDPILTANSLTAISRMALSDNNNMRSYITGQMLPSSLKALYLEAKKLVPKLREKDVSYSDKAGIRPQLYSKHSNILIDDFLIRQTHNTTHILNAISPAFTASFALSEYIVSASNLNI